MANIYLVSGSTGEYSDRNEWNVVAFKNEEKGEAFRDKLNLLCNKAGVHNSSSWDISPEDEKAIKELDPYFHADYTGTVYYLQAIDLQD